MKINYAFPTLLTLSISLFLSLNACRETPKQASADSLANAQKDAVIDNIFVNEEIQSQLTPDRVIEILKQRNMDFVNGELTIRNTDDRLQAAKAGQYPAAVVLSCLDSRVPVEDVFHSGIGDLFVARVAGNIVNEDILGSLEYGCKVSKAKVILVLGHEDCGAVKSAVNHVEMGNITKLLDKIEPAMDSLKLFEGDPSPENNKYLDAVTKQNVKNTIASIRKKSPILKKMEKDGEIKIIGGMYTLETGKVDFF